MNHNKLEVLVQREGLCGGGSLGIGGGGGRGVNSSFGIIRYTLLEEISLALEGDHIHKVEGVRHVIHLVIAESHKKSVGDELDVLAHKLGVHADESNREGI